MIYRLFALLCLLASTSAFGSVPNARVVAEIRRADTIEEQVERTARGLDGLLRVACWQVRRSDPELSTRICSEWKNEVRPALLALANEEAIGDHEPVSAWLAVATLMIKQAIIDATGSDVLFYLLRLDDLDVFNFGIKVAFDPNAGSDWCAETIAAGEVSCREEYLAHANPLMGATSYWIASLSCSFASAGALVLICSPIGTATEMIVMRTVGPKIAYRVWDRANPE